MDLLKAPVKEPLGDSLEAKGPAPVMFGNPAATVVPTSDVEFAPWIKRVRRFGSLNVVLPSPAPCVVPMAAKSFEYVVLETFDPLQKSQPSGTAF